MPRAVRGSEALTAKFQSLSAKAREEDRTKVVCGYDCPYAIFVHENLAMAWKGRPRRPSPPKSGVYWGPNGMAKFLERPMRRLSKAGTLTRIISRALARGLTIRQALWLVGQKIKEESTAVVPVDTGRLKASFYISIRK